MESGPDPWRPELEPSGMIERVIKRRERACLIALGFEDACNFWTWLVDHHVLGARRAYQLRTWKNVHEPLNHSIEGWIVS